MDDLISRQAAIDAMCELMHHWFGGNPKDEIREIKRELERLPSAQPSGKDPIEREAVVDILHDAMQGCSESEENLIGEIVCKVDLLPSAQPEIIHCRECKHHIDRSFCQKANHHTSDTDCCASVFGAERMEE